jgi:long-chain acyl-CoA synthetase
MSIEPADSNRPFPSIDVPHQTNIHPCIARDENDAAVITFTSGTTGSAKGVVTTFGNLLYQIRSFRSVMQNDAHCSAVSILPLSHLFELTAGFLGLLYGGGSICYVNTLMPDDIVAAMRQQQITCMVTVPLFLKLLANAVRREIAKLPRLRRRLIALALRVSPSLPLKIRRRAFSKIHRRFGGKLEYFVSGGAPLDEVTMQFFDSIGLPVYQGYGLAEASPVITTNGPLANRTGSVGKPLPGIELRIDQDNGGEILTRGPHVMRGYFGDPVLTQEMKDSDGWLHTGDLGYIDNDGFLFVSGRKKNIIVLGSGKKVQPEEIEDVLFEHPFIQEGCIVGAIARKGLLAGSEEVCAIAVASEAAIRQCANDSANILNELRSIIQQRSAQLAPCKRPTRIVLRTEPLPRTSSRKVRRHSLREWVAQEVVSS